MSTQTFQEAVLEQLSQKGVTTAYYLKPINAIQLLDTNGNTIQTIQDMEINYSNGVLTITAVFTAITNTTIGQVLIGNLTNNTFYVYFTQNTTQQIQAENIYEIVITITLNNIKLNLSPFTTATANINGLANLLGEILVGNPLKTGKSGQYLDAIYVINNIGNNRTSFRIPVTILTVENGTLYIGGVAPNTISGNTIQVRDANQNVLLSVTSTTSTTIKKGRVIIFELSIT